MDKDNIELINRLFAVATMLLEDAIEPAIAGQSSKLTSTAYARLAHQLEMAATDLAAVIQAVSSIRRFDNR